MSGEKTGKAVRLVVMRKDPALSEDELRDSAARTDTSSRPSRTVESTPKT